MQQKIEIITEEQAEQYLLYLKNEERAPATLQKYRYELRRFCVAMQGQKICKENIIAYKKQMLQSRAAVTVNAALVAINGLLTWLGWHSCRVRLVRVQRQEYRDPARELTRAEYDRLVNAAKRRKDDRLCGILQTIASTGIRVSELCFITVEAVHTGVVQVRNKGKSRTVFLCRSLQKWLLGFCHRHGRKSGAVFVTRNGLPLDRCNIWAMMKTLCRAARVQRQKVFPHNLRHLFASLFYRQERDLEHLASLLGHSSIDTTRLYTKTAGAEHQRQIERMHLVI